MRDSLIPPRPSLRWLAAIGAAGVLIGLSVALVAGVQSLNDATRSGAAGAPADASAARLFPPPSASPSPSLSAGKLGAAPRLYAGDAQHLLLVGASAAYASSDGGATWTKLASSPGSGLAPDSAQPQRMIAGGSGIWTSADGGATWQQVTSVPASARAPYLPLAVNPDDPAVWFLAAGAQILRTRDAGVSWRLGLTGVPALSAPVLRPAGAKDAFLLGNGPHVYLLQDNGQQVQELGGFPGSAAVADLGALGGGAYAAGTADGQVYVYAGAWKAAGVAGGVLGAGPGRLVVAAGGGKLGATEGTSVSLDGGATWSQASGLPPDQSVEAVAFASDGTAFAYCYGGDVFASTDGGRTWKPRSSALRG